MTGFGRTMIYRFDHDWHGEVIAEQTTGLAKRYLGHHFPASDIPAQARDLYTRTLLRVIPDVDGVSGAIGAATRPRDAASRST